MSRAGSLTNGMRAISRPRTLFGIGLASLVCVAMVMVALGFKPKIQTFVRPGDTIAAEFPMNYQVHVDETRVQLSGLEVGVVSDIEPTERGTTMISMKIDESAIGLLGDKPSALVKPSTILGGNYAIELKPGGNSGSFQGDVIPRERTATPQELDRVLEALPAPTRKSLQNTVDKLDATLGAGGSDAIGQLVTNAPSTLRPAGEVLEAAQGTRPGVDLPQVVTNLNSVASALTRRDGQLTDIVSSLHKTTAVLAEQSEPLADGIDTLPATLRATRSGMIDLRGTLDRLARTAPSLGPTVKELDPLLKSLDPALDKAQPLMRDLRPLMADAEPAVRQLVPFTQEGTKTLAPLRGPVLERVNGPIAHSVLNTWRGTGPYKDSGGGIQADHKFYEELAYLTSNLARASMTQDKQGALLGFQVGVNTRSVAGSPLDLPNLLKQLQIAAGGAP